MLTFEGRELFTLECTGSFAKEHARELVPSSLQLQIEEDRAIIGLLYFQMHRLSASVFGWPAFSYQELLWRIGVVVEGSPAWFGLCCELDDALVQRSAEAMFQYTTTRSIFERDGSRLQVRGAEATSIQFEAKEAIATLAPRRMIVSRGKGLYEIKWRERPATKTLRAKIAATTTKKLDTLRWEEDGLLLEGRTHICEVARAFKR